MGSTYCTCILIFVQGLEPDALNPEFWLCSFGFGETSEKLRAFRQLWLSGRKVLGSRLGGLMKLEV